MKRLKDWPSRFAALVESARARPFEWGAHDCCLWAADAVKAVTGNDPAAPWRATYRTERAAMAILARLGGHAAVGALGGPEISPRLAIAGDVGLVRWTDGTKSLGVFGGHWWLCVADQGLTTMPIDAALRAWGVGRE
jgi:hypothetical protein